MKKVLYFTASWCQPCKRVRPIVEELIAENAGEFIIIDADENIELVRRYQLQSVPTFILIEDEIEVNRVTGAKTKEELLEFFNTK